MHASRSPGWRVRMSPQSDDWEEQWWDVNERLVFSLHFLIMFSPSGAETFFYINMYPPPSPDSRHLLHFASVGWWLSWTGMTWLFWGLGALDFRHSKLQLAGFWCPALIQWSQLQCHKEAPDMGWPGASFETICQQLAWFTWNFQLLLFSHLHRARKSNQWSAL